MNIKLEQLKVFVAVADCGSITDAAAQIGRTAAAVSMTLSQIEHQIGERLFDGERKSKLTPLGQHTLRQARRAVDEHRHALREISRFASGEEGLSRIAVVPSVATALLPAAVSDLSRQHSGIQIDIRDTDSEAIHAALLAGTVDFGIASKPADDSLRAEFFLADPFRLICRRDHRLARLGRAVEWRDIDDEAFIVNGLCQQIDNPDLQRLIANAGLFMHNTLSILAFVEYGFGVTLLPAMTQPASEALCALPLARLEAERELYVLRRKSGSLSPLDERLIAVIRKQAELMLAG